MILIASWFLGKRGAPCRRRPFRPGRDGIRGDISLENRLASDGMHRRHTVVRTSRDIVGIAVFTKLAFFHVLQTPADDTPKPRLKL